MNEKYPQFTLERPFELTGIEPYGGNSVRVGFSSLPLDSGVIFRTKAGYIPADIHLASQYRSSVLLKNKGAGILHVEHLLATLYSYGVDNALIEVKRVPSKSFSFLDKLGLATDLEVIPNFEGKTYELCRNLEQNLRELDKPRKLLGLERRFGDLDKERLVFEPRQEEGMTITAVTKYPVLGEQVLRIRLNAENYREQISKSRPYSKHGTGLPISLASAIATVANLDFGFGHGFDETNVLLPVQNKTDAQKRTLYPQFDEPVRHTIMDRLGSIALLPGRLDSMNITAKFSGHANDIKILKNLLKHLKKL